jgi:hypothetical protein
MLQTWCTKNWLWLDAWQVGSSWNKLHTTNLPCSITASSDCACFPNKEHYKLNP